jgi:RecJ-like exonuclease
MPTSSPPLATESRSAVCLLCGGAGEICTSVPGGTFDTQQEQWYPDERAYTCPKCKGKGELEETFCLVCSENVEMCSCTDEEIGMYLLTVYLGLPSPWKDRSSK